MNRFLNNLKIQAEDNPVLAMAVAAGLITSVSKLLGTTVDMKNASAWKQEVARRAMKDGLKK